MDTECFKSLLSLISHHYTIRFLDATPHINIEIYSIKFFELFLKQANPHRDSQPHIWDDVYE